MNLLDRLERRFGRYAVPHLTMSLLFGQVAVWLLVQAGALDLRLLELRPAAVLRGEWWRLASFLLIPPLDNAIFLVFAWYLFHLMGTALEHHWGNFRYNVFVGVGWAATVAVSFLTPWAAAGNGFLGGSIFLAFAWLNPRFVLMLFFVLPIEIRWLALVTWIFYGITFVFGDMATKLNVLAAVGNFLLFFGPDLIARARMGRRAMRWDAERFIDRGEAFHRCVVCGATERTHPDREFRYCTQCDGSPCYCDEHLASHTHRRAGGKETTDA